MIPYPEIDPVAFRILGWSIHWYGLMYLSAFGTAMLLSHPLLRRAAFAKMPSMRADDMLAAGVAGVIIGGRLGYVLFYNPSFYFDSPSHIIRIWDGGMSFHGGLLGVIAALWLFARKNKLQFWRVMDFAAVLTPIGLGLGRIGNFINGELPGRAASENIPWRMIFPDVDRIARHPSSLYQAILEGVMLAAVMWWLTRRHRRPGELSAAFLFGYAGCRLFSEFFREPDSHLGLFFGFVSMGQILSVPMVFAAAIILWREELQQWLSSLARASAEVKTSPSLAPTPSTPTPILTTHSPVEKDEKETKQVDVDDSNVDDSDSDVDNSNSDVNDSNSTAEEDDDDGEYEDEDEDDSPKRTRKSWWKKLFPGEVESQRHKAKKLLTRRAKRRLKKKKRNR